ncbi:MAG: Xaa-Pro peptidase family protein [Actinobacteria bacterium]|nr:Xaa-Pro peptidase family protein [Actinomycetota bacterium]
MDHLGRLEKLRAKLDDAGVDSLLVTNLTNVRYLTGFSGTNGQVLVTTSDAVFLTDPRYEARAGDLVSGADVAIYPTRLVDALKPRLDAATGRRVGVESATMTLAQRDDLADRLPGVELVPVEGLVEDLRRTKEPGEIDAIRAAVEIADDAYTWVIDRLVPGATEREVALDLEVRMRLAGADNVSFDPIVGSGPLSAHIHHTPSDRAFDKGDLVLLDFGCRVDGYCSDMTRTVVLGPASDEQRETYETVLRAQLAGIAAVSAGTPPPDVDAAARAVIDAAGRGAGFPHGLGHGVGLDIHETPAMRLTTDPLVAAEVITIEPGIYNVGDGGVRIEDMVVVADSGCDVLTGSPKDTLLEL